MATTLANLRAKLNGEIGVDADGEALPWSAAVRNAAISDGYAELWRVGIWKPLTQSIATADNAWLYALTSLREVYRVELLDSSSNIIDQPQFTVEDDGAGGYQLILPNPIFAGYTMTARGWGAYKSTFSGDSDPDDLAAEYNRIPLLKAKAILMRQQLARFARYAERRNNPPELSVDTNALLAIVATAEREFDTEAKRLRDRRLRYMRPTRVLVTP